MLHATAAILQTDVDADRALWLGKRAAIEHRMDGLPRAELDMTRHAISERRADAGFNYTWAPILTPPAWNMKLNKAAVPSFGITLQHHVFRSKEITDAGKPLVVNFCPKAGQCTSVCVMNGGSGMFDAVQRGRNWKNELLLHDPWSFFVHLGWELQRALVKHDGYILLRPNVNSDLQWERIAPTLVNGSTFQGVTCYGYTKLPHILETDGWVAPHYRVAYSFNERSSWTSVLPFLDRGGSVAVVTDRKAKHAKRPVPEVIQQWHPTHEVVDADVSDEWIFRESVIGDLAAKGRATSLIGKPRSFVQSIYHVQP